MPSRYFEDLEVGETHESRRLTVTEDEIVEFASKYDPLYFHTDPESARSHPQFGGLVASGIHNLAIWRMLDHEITGDVHWICGVEWKSLRWNKPLRAGDTVRAKAEIVDKRTSPGRDDRGIADYRYSLINQDDVEVFYFVSSNLVERRPG